MATIGSSFFDLIDLHKMKGEDGIAAVIEMLKEIPEYREACRNNAGPRILLGSPGRSAGKIFVDMTGGTEGSKDIFKSLVNSGVNTIVGMHLSDDHRKEAEKHHLNVLKERYGIG